MDPNATLTRIRKLATRNHEERPLNEDEVDQLTDAIASLDAWIRGGGFLPAAWEGNR